MKVSCRARLLEGALKVAKAVRNTYKNSGLGEAVKPLIGTGAETIDCARCKAVDIDIAESLKSKRT
jgi:hypothetical protein